MRDRLTPYTGADRLNYLCLFALDTLGVRNLRDVPVLLGGHRSIGSARPPAQLLEGIHHLRLAGLQLTTTRALELFVEQYESHHRRRERDAEPKGPPRRFRMMSDLGFSPLWEGIEPDDIAEARAAIARTPPLAARTIPPLAETDRALSVDRGDGQYVGRISPIGFEPPAPPVYDLERLPREPGFVSWADLLAQADRFDASDAAAGRLAAGQPGWRSRLESAQGIAKVELLEPGRDGLQPAAGLTLSGIRHLIGLPGAGKTTLLTLLAAVLASRGHRACFLFPSIEVATAFIEVLDRYGIDTGLLYGQSESARAKHVQNFAASMAPRNGGFGASRPTAMHFASNCALAGWASVEEHPFPHRKPPCLDVRNPDSSSRRRLCALAGVCGRQHAERRLADAAIVAGHVLSLDRRASPLYCDRDVRHFEWLARSFDLVVVDECDDAQASLDERGTSVMRLVSTEHTLTQELMDSVHGRVMGGRNAFLRMDHMGSVTEMSGRFILANSRLVHVVMHMRSAFKAALTDKLLTSASLFAELYPAPDEASDEAVVAHQRRRESLERLWDIAAKRVAYRTMQPGDEEDERFDDGRVSPEGDAPAQDMNAQALRARPDAADDEAMMRQLAETLGWPLDQVMAQIDRYHRALHRWDTDVDERSMRAVVEALRFAPGFSSPLTLEEFDDVASLLTAVTLVVLQFFGLAPFLRILNSAGLIEDNIFESRPSVDKLRILPESLLGRLAGLRYSVAPDGDVHVQHVSIAGVPRLLPQRIASLGALEGRPSPVVLLTSATSMLEASPSFHVDVGPHYLLRRPDAGKGWSQSRYHVLGLPVPGQPDQHLRFSGQRFALRQTVLRQMTDALLGGGTFGPVRAALEENDVTARGGRKAAFVVNSYEQCQDLMTHITQMHPDWVARTRCLVRGVGHGVRAANAVTAADVEALGRDDGWDLLIFPMAAIGRGVNIVHQFGDRAGDAMLGSLFFLTRPHPRGDSLQLLQGLAGSASARFDQRDFADETSLQARLEAYQLARRQIRATVARLFEVPLQARRLGPLARPFVADQMVNILQTIGRAMRNDCAAYVYFVDAAWAPNSVAGKPDTRQTSMLVMMRSILSELLAHENPATRAFYANLYGPFMDPLSRVEGLIG